MFKKLKEDLVETKKRIIEQKPSFFEIIGGCCFIFMFNILHWVIILGMFGGLIGIMVYFTVTGCVPLIVCILCVLLVLIVFIAALFSEKEFGDDSII